MEITWNDDVRSEDMLRRVKSKGVSYILTVKRMKAASIGHTWYKNCLLKDVVKRKLEGRSDMKTREKR
jgi:hypothetical protein